MANIKQTSNLHTVICSWLFIAICLPVRLIITILMAGGIPTAYSFSQGAWTQKTNFGGTARVGAVGFSIGAKGYIGTGAVNISGPLSYQDFWEWDQATNVWTQKANFSGAARVRSVGFSIGAKGYVGTGWNGSTFYNDFWEWDQATNTWIRQADFGGTGRIDAVGFSIGAKGYIGTGQGTIVYQDLWEWDQANNVWAQKANLVVAGSACAVAVGFFIGAKGYIGTGMNASTWPLGKQDFWEWDQATNVWTQKANFGGTARSESTGFSIGNYGYIGIGTTSIGSGATPDFWQYDPAINTWTQKANFGGGLREMAVGFSIGCKGYIGTGFINDNTATTKQDFWEYCPDASNTSCTPCGSILNAVIFSQNVLCNGQCTGTATVTPTGGTSPYTYSWVPATAGQTTQVITGLCAGTYTVTVTDVVPTTITATVTIMQPAVLTATATFTAAACSSNNGTASVTAGGGSPSYTYSWNAGGQTSQTSTGLAAGTYTATVTDANGCTTTQTVSVVSSGSITVSQSASVCSGSTYTLPGGTVVSTGGIYNDTLTSVNGCDSIITTTLTINSNPTANASSNVTITQGQSATLTASGGGTYSWYPSTGLSCTACSNPTATASPLLGAGGLVYCVMVTDTNNCTDTACVTVTIEQIDCSHTGELYLPNAFSPDNDGENDVLQIYYGNLKCIKTFKLVIYNRWGEKVYETTNPTAQWDGFYNGKPENASVFVYYMGATLISGEEIIRKGNVSLMR